MKIISKFKDYYDYLTGIYGIDEKVVLDRRYDFFVKPIELRDGETWTEHGPEGYNFAITGKRYVVYHYRDKFYSGLAGLNELNKVLFREGGAGITLSYYWYSRKYDFHTGSGFKEPVEIEEKDWKKYHEKNKTDVNVEMREPILVMSGKEWVPNVILNDFSFASVIPPEEIYVQISSFISWLIDNPPEPDKQTNKGKIVSHGFDLKTSFRPNMKK